MPCDSQLNFLCVPQHRNIDLCVGISPDHVLGLVQTDFRNLFTLYLSNDITDQHAGICGAAVRLDLDHLKAFFGIRSGNGHADTYVLVVHLLHVRRIILGRNIVAPPVAQRPYHCRCCRIFHSGFIFLADKALLNELLQLH